MTKNDVMVRLNMVMDYEVVTLRLMLKGNAELTACCTINYVLQIYSLAKGVCCKALALAASALATNTYVSAINLHQCSAADLNPYDSVLY